MEREYEISLFEKALPSIPGLNTPPVAEHPTTTSKVHPKPTDHLPGDHGEAEGEADRPAFDDGRPVDDATKPSTSATASGTMVPTADEGWFSDMSTLVSHQKWVFGAAGIVLLFGVLAGVFLCRRAGRHRRATEQYSALPGEDVALGVMPHGSRAPRTKELYDAFGEHEDDDADENTGLRGISPGGPAAGLGFHEGFLDDEDPNTPRTVPTPSYRDEPEAEETPRRGAESPNESGSGDGSWEHASQPR
jgi:kexin